MSVRVPVAPAVLEWAQERSGHSADEVEHRFGRWHEWVTGDTSPTVNQVEELASFTHLPFGFFFLEEPPKIELPIPDYRLGAHGRRLDPSPELLDSVYASQQRQDWFRDYALRNGLEPSDLFGAATGMTPFEAARLVTSTFGFVPGERPRRRQDARNDLRRRFEDLGGLVIFAGIVGNNTSRVLAREEFRGFTLADEYVPLVFVNANDTLAGQLFTFFHELGHVLRAESGVSDEDVRNNPADGAERWCNELTAEVLVPEADLRREFRPDAELRAELDRLGNRYLCSTLVVLVRLRDSGLIPRGGFEQLFTAERDRVDAILRDATKGEGGNFWNNQPFRTSERFARAVLSDTREGRTPYTEALPLLGLRAVGALDVYASHLGMP